MTETEKKPFTKDNVQELLDFLANYKGWLVFFCESNCLFGIDRTESWFAKNGTCVNVCEDHRYLEVLDLPKGEYRNLRHFITLREDYLKKVDN